MKQTSITAEQLFAMIGGRSQAVKRPKDASVDRKLRNMVFNAQAGGRVIINAGDGEGYFEADMNDPDEAMMAKHYVNAQKSRVRKQAANIRAMENTMANTNQMEFEDDLEGIW